MTFIVDARKLPCPQPVVLTIKAMEEASDITTIVSSKIAKENVTRLANDRGFSLNIAEEGDDFRLHMVRLSPEGEARSTPRMPSTASPANGECACEVANGENQVLLLTSNAIGHSDEALGEKLMTSFVQILGELPEKPRTIIFMNSAVKLVVKGASTIEDLKDYEQSGIKLLACGTCLNHYGLTDSVAAGEISNMYDIASTLFAASKIVSP